MWDKSCAVMLKMVMMLQTVKMVKTVMTLLMVMTVMKFGLGLLSFELTTWRFLLALRRCMRPNFWCGLNPVLRLL